MTKAFFFISTLIQHLPLQTPSKKNPWYILALQHKALTLSPPNKLSSAKFPVCFNFQSASMSLDVGENVVCMSNSLDPDETQNVSSRFKLFAYGTLVVIGRLRVKSSTQCKTRVTACYITLGYHSFVLRSQFLLINVPAYLKHAFTLYIYKHCHNLM